MSHTTIPGRRLVWATAALVLTLGCLAGLAGSALAASDNSTQFSVNTKVNAGVLAKGRSVNAHVKVTNPQRQVKSWWSSSTISGVVRKGVNGKYQMPYRSNGFRCTPVVKAAATNFTCTLIGADVPTIVTVKFQAMFQPASHPGLGGSAPIFPTNLIVNVSPGSAGEQQITVPAGVTSAVVLMQGGAGDRSKPSFDDRVGAAVTGTLSVTPGEVLTVGAGTEASGVTGGWGPAGMTGGQGSGAMIISPTIQKSGGGGGASAILDGSTPLIVAGGGGGNGQMGNFTCDGATGDTYNGFGGSGGAPGSADLNGSPCSAKGVTATGGAGGGMATGAGGNSGFSDSRWATGGGGGGGGYLGGVAGGVGEDPTTSIYPVGGGGGGAGSSYVDPARVSESAISSAPTAANGSVQIYWIGSVGWVPANGQTHTITAPAGATGVSFLAIGGGGGSTGGIGNAGHGGNGALVAGSLAVTPGQTFQITAGNRGAGSTAGGGNGSPGGVGLTGYTGGAGGSGGGSDATGGGGGGAATIVQSNGTTLIVAGGGGGAGAGDDDNGGSVEHGNGGDGGATADNGSKGFGIDGGGAGKGGYGPTGVGQTAQSDSYDFVGGGGGGGVLGGSAGTAGGGDGFGTGGGGGAGSSIASSALRNISIATAPSATDGFVIIAWTIS